MKKTQRQEPHPAWTEVTEKFISSKAFASAWEQLDGSGTGAVQNSLRVDRLLSASDWHRNAIQTSAELMLKIAAEWVQRPDTDQSAEQFYAEALALLRSVASSYGVMGAMIGALAYSGIEKLQAEVENIDGETIQ